MFCSYYFKNEQPRHFCFYILWDGKSGFGLSVFLIFFCQNQGFCFDEIVLIKKECNQVVRFSKAAGSHLSSKGIFLVFNTIIDQPHYRTIFCRKPFTEIVKLTKVPKYLKSIQFSC